MPPKPKNKSVTDNATVTAIGDGDPDAPVTYRGLEAVLSKHLDKTIEVLRSNLEATTKVANDALTLVKKLEKEIAGLKEENIKLKKNVTNESSNVKQNENRIEDRTNRQLRKTLVFHNIPELEAETWDQTEKLVAEAIADVCDIDVKEAAENLERVHRSAPNPRYKGTAPRKIFAALYDWKFSERCKSEFKSKNISQSTKIICEQMYGPLTRARRDLAMKERKRLKENNKIISGYVDFPAKLMAKSKKDGKYELVKDFSGVEIKLGKRD